LHRWLFFETPRLGDDARIGHFLPITEQQLPARYKALAAFSSAAILASSSEIAFAATSNGGQFAAHRDA
jgi:hypothetical protein